MKFNMNPNETTVLWLAGALTMASMSWSASAAPLNLSQSPPSGVKEPAPNVVVTVDDSGSMKEAGMQALRDALKATFAADNVPDGAIRLAWQSLNRCKRLPLDYTTSTGCGIYNGMRLLDSAHRSNFMNWVDTWLYYSSKENNNTPSHLAVARVAEYFKSKGDYNPWRDYPGDTTKKSELSCRKAFHVFMTDGAWNSTNGVYDGEAVSLDGNADGTSKLLPDGVLYDTSSGNVSTRLYRDPWGSSRLSTFSDLIFHLWSTDLRPDLPDNVKFRQNVVKGELIGNQTIPPYWNPKNNPATWQHLVTYTIGFTDAGTKWTAAPVWGGDMYSGAGIDSLMAGTITWDSPLCGESRNDPCPPNTDFTKRTQELWHAALNGRGRYVRSQTASDLRQAFSDILQSIQAESLSGAVSIASSTRRLRQDGVIYLASFKSEPWAGDVSSSDISAGSTDVETVPNWSAAAKLDAVNIINRVVMTSNGSQGVEFLWGNLTAAQKDDLKGPGGTDSQGQDRLNYLRGDRTKEASQPGGTLRTRASRLGTIVNSNLWVNSVSPIYPVEYPGHAAYRKWVRELNNGTPRATIIFAGANDGMLHAFYAPTGDERLAYVPLGAYPKLRAYTAPSYTHQYIVDGSPFTGDVDVSQSGAVSGVTPVWRTLLASPLGAGGRGFAVLDLTTTFPNELKLASSVVVDRSFGSTATTANFPGFEDVGHITAYPTTDVANPVRADQFVKLNNGRWALLMGNGVNSINERPVLLIQYLDSAREISFLVANSTKGAGNGLGAPRPVDVDGNGTTDVVYAGDIQGQMWKFDLTSNDPQKWGMASWGTKNVCYASTTLCQPLMTALSSDNKRQPITGAPTWVLHPMGGLVLNFGTGQLLEDKDRRNTTTQSIYGVWDSSQYTRSGQGVTVLNGPNVPVGSTRTSLVQQSFTSVVTRSVDSIDQRQFVNSTSNPVNYSTTSVSAPRGWFIDLPEPGERSLSHPRLTEGRLVRFETQIPPQTPEDGLCASSIRSEKGYVNTVSGLTGQPGKSSAYISPDTTLDLSNATRVQFGLGESIEVETGGQISLIPSNVDGKADILGESGAQYLKFKLQLRRQASIPRTVDWRILP